MNKSLAFFDGLDAVDKLGYNTFKTSIDVLNSETGEVIFKGLKNKVIIPGSGLIARKLFDLSSGNTEVTPTYNTAITTSNTNLVVADPASGYVSLDDNSVPASIRQEFNTGANQFDHRVLLFCCGTDGCGEQNSQVYPVDYKKWIAPENLVPFRYQIGTNDLSDDLRKKYFGRTEIRNNDQTEYVAYYFKKFESTPRFVQQYSDGTPINSDTNVYSNSNINNASSYVEINLKITKQDIRDFFRATTGQDSARINTISLCSAYPVYYKDNQNPNDAGHVYYKDIRPMTKLNFPNESFIDVSKGIDIIYHIYM